jgi:hypothetical protein
MGSSQHEPLGGDLPGIGQSFTYHDVGTPPSSYLKSYK